MKTDRGKTQPPASDRTVFLRAGAGGALLAPRVRLQAAATAPTALYGNKPIRSKGKVMNDHEHEGSHDFDLYFGHWRIHNQRLKERLAGCTDWEQFDAIGECAPILGGIGNIDSFESDWNGGFRGMTLRLFDRQSRKWSLYWASNCSGVLEPPVVGAFADGVGRFEGADQHHGKPVLARFLWSHITATSARWEQALSADGGMSWETNWRMQMTRIEH
jgi:hypothetical protein